MNKTDKIYIAGHRGLVGSAIWKNLESKGYKNLIGRTRKELDLLDVNAVKRFFDEIQPEYVILAAAKVGGIVGFLIMSHLLNINIKMGIAVVLAIVLTSATQLMELYRLKSNYQHCTENEKICDFTLKRYMFMIFICFILIMFFIKPLWFVTGV